MSGYGEGRAHPMSNPSLLLSWTIVGPEVSQGGIQEIVLSTDAFLSVVNELGVRTWNRWTADWLKRNWICPCWSDGEPQPTVIITLDFDGARLSNLALDGLDLRFANLRGSSFQGSLLKAARFELWDISGTDFKDARLDDATFKMATYDVDQPPIGLPAHVMRQCSVLDGGDSI